MKANKVLAGRICPGCNKALELGEDVFNCQVCHGSMHASCRDAARACMQFHCPTRQEQAVANKTAAAGTLAPAPAPGGETKPCPYCGEQILASALKCRFCGEHLSAAGRMRQERIAKTALTDENLTTAEIVFSILCSGIACILGLVWLIQGKKKGGKMLAIAVITNVIIRGLMALLD